ncbi:hypothetical protein TNCV_1835421 [Trichonephila clavipes]|nr:hypothetical protein TNCV_1835421 [Trichonephila clavipes]
MSIARKFIEVIGEDIFASKMKRLEISLEEDNFFRATTSQSSNNSRSTELNLFQFLKQQYTGKQYTGKPYSSMGLMRAKKVSLNVTASAPQSLPAINLRILKRFLHFETILLRFRGFEMIEAEERDSKQFYSWPKQSSTNCRTVRENHVQSMKILITQM